MNSMRFSVIRDFKKSMQAIHLNVGFSIAFLFIVSLNRICSRWVTTTLRLLGYRYYNDGYVVSFLNKMIGLCRIKLYLFVSHNSGGIILTLNDKSKE